MGPDRGAPGANSSRARSSKVTKSASRKKSGTSTTKNHRFESFSQRIAKFNVDPVRRAQGRAHIHQQDEASHFVTAFEEWKDLNMSENFTAFVKLVEPLAHNLPQILHYEEQIMDHIVHHIQKGNSLSLEPLLNLVAHFAHDLGTRFEAHFQKVVSVISLLAASNPDVEVIEWSFTCLAWLFKYLSRLLVPDLRPVYNLMAPLLGKQHQKPFVTRFAAEAMSFLIRKAGALTSKNQTPLRLIIQHGFADLASTSREQIAQYQQGLTVLYAEAIKGVQNGIHSSGKAIATSLLSVQQETVSCRSEHAGSVQYIVECILIDVIHNTDQDGFVPILEAIHDFTELPNGQLHSQYIRLLAHMLFVISATREGTRISDWSCLLHRLSSLLDAVNKDPADFDINTKHSVLNTVAVMICYAPFDELVPVCRQYFNKIDDEYWDPVFLSFCSFSAEVSFNRFESLILPEMQKFIASRWAKYESQLCFLLPQFGLTGALNSSHVRIPKAWQERMLEKLEILAATPVASKSVDQELELKINLLMATCNSYLDIIGIFREGIVVSESINSAALKMILYSALPTVETEQSGTQAAFAMSKALSFVTGSGISAGTVTELLNKALKAAPLHAQRPNYLKGILYLIKRKDPQTNLESLDTKVLVHNLIENLAGPSHELRLLSLEILCALYQDVPDGLNAALSLEMSEFSLENARAASLCVRRVAAAFTDSAIDENIRKAFPAYCFGLLHVRLTSLWEDACNALKSMSDVKGQEELIMQRAIGWVKNQVIPREQLNDEAPIEPLGAEQGIQHQFDCSNLMALERLAFQSSVETEPAEMQLLRRAKEDLLSQPREDVINRAQGLRVLRAMPRLAERKSRALVPILLDWALEDGAEISEGQECNNSVDSIVKEDINLATTERWSRKDQKDLLTLFASFVNPSVLYRSEAVYSALLNLLCNGDVEIQQSALKAAFAWNLPSIKPYEEHLANVLDDARFREEVTIFLNVDEADSEIRREHRAALMPVLLRLLYGRIVSRSGSSSTRGTQLAKRKAVLMSLSRYGNRELSEFLEISLGSLDHISVLNEGMLDEVLLARDISSLRKQVGMLRMLGNTIEVLGAAIFPFVERVINAILYCLIRVNRQLNSRMDCSAQDEESLALQNTSLLKDGRQEGLNCLTLLFNACPDFDWKPYAPTIMHELVVPRLDRLPVETAQSVAGLLKLFSTWSSSTGTVSLLIDPNPSLLEKISDCLIEPSSKDEVRIFVLKNILENFLDFALSNSESEPPVVSVRSKVEDQLRDGLGHSVLQRVSKMLESTSSKECLEPGIRTVVRLAFCATKSFDVKALIKTSLHLLRQPPRLINPRLKSEVLGLLKQFIPLYDFPNDENFSKDASETLSSLFSYFRDGQNRTLLVSVYSQLAEVNFELKVASDLCGKLNAFSSARLDEPDFEQRLQAFQIINDEQYRNFTAEQWQPLIYNMLFLIKDNEELSIRTSASLSLRRFVQTACLSSDTPGPLTKLLTDAILPDLQSGMRETSELVRAEYVALLAELVKSDWPAVSDMKCLLGPDDESSFFNNILHIQQHRRVRALRRMATGYHSICSLNISRFCLPLIQNFFADVEDGAQNLATEAINTLESLAEGLEWPRYRALLQRNVNDAAKLESKLRIRALAAVTNSLSRAFSAKPSCSPQIIESGDQHQESPNPSNLARTLPGQDTLYKSLSNSVFAKLTELIHYKDESTVDLRVLISVVAIKVAMVFPAERIEQSLPSILMDVCNILKSKAQEARDVVRKTLADISAIVGPRYFGFIIKQLRTALQRGSHLHVLSYTVHQILVLAAPSFKPGDIDYCLGDLMGVIMNDIFGATGQEKEAQDYISKMKEVRKKTLGYDSMELIASITTLPYVSNLLRPIREQLEKPRTKLEPIDELLRRLREGLRRNETVNDRDFLTLSYEILNEAYQRVDTIKGGTSQASYKMASFALELLRRVLDKHEILKTSENLAGFVPMLRKAMEEDVEEVQMSAMRLMTSIIKVPLKAIDDNAKIYIRRCKSLIDASASTNAPIAQAALRLVSAILRERPNANITKADFDNNIAYLLKRIKPDLQEPSRLGERDRQVAAFNFLKAVVGRKEPVSEAYEVMDVVREVMITSQEHPIPDLARSVYSRFVLDYFPDEMKGFSKQMDFLVGNLQYAHPRGRLSVMEVIMFVLTRKAEAAVQPTLVTFFLPLVVVLGTDADEQCRESANLILRKILERADKEHMKIFKSQMFKWLDVDSDTDPDALWKGVGLQCWQIFFDLHVTANKDASTVFAKVTDVIEGSADDTTTSAKLVYRALDLLKKLCEHYPSITFGVKTSGLWSAVTTSLTQESEGANKVRSTAASLISMYFADFARTTAKLDGRLQALPLAGSGGLELTAEEASSIVKTSMRVLQNETYESIITQVVQNVAFIGRMSTGGASPDLLNQLFRQASSVVRVESNGRPPRAKLAALKLIAALCKLVDAEHILPTLEDILLPLHNLTDAAIPVASSSSDPAYQGVQEELVELAQEQLVALQTKMGTSVFVSAMQEVQKGVKGRREERRTKRRIEAVSAPERAEVKKQKKHESTKNKRKAKGALEAGRRRGW